MYAYALLAEEHAAHIHRMGRNGLALPTGPDGDTRRALCGRPAFPGRSVDQRIAPRHGAWTTSYGPRGGTDGHR